MKRVLLALLLAASVVAVAQDPKTGAPKTAAEKKADKKAEKKAEKKAMKEKAAQEAQAAAKPAPAPAPAPAPKPAPAAAAKAAPAAPAKAAAASGAILANKDSKTYHRADCKVAGKIKEANRVSFASAAEADKAGYKACKVCKP